MIERLILSLSKCLLMGKILNLNEIKLIHLFFMVYTFCILLKKFFPNMMPYIYPPILSSESFIIFLFHI